MIQTVPSRDIDRGTLFMNKFTIGFSILSTLVIGAGCTDEASIVDETPTGKAVFALTSGAFAVTGTLTIDPAAPGDDIVETIVNDGAPTLVVELEPGDYTATLTAWTLFEGGGPIAVAGNDADNVELDGITPDPIVIAALTNTNATINFSINTVPLVFVPENDGTATFTLAIGGDNGCDDDCEAGEECVVVGAGAPACLETCAVVGPVAPDCDGGAACLAGDDGSNVNICGPL
jgi:hypothetical protein